MALPDHPGVLELQVEEGPAVQHLHQPLHRTAEAGPGAAGDDHAAHFTSAKGLFPQARTLGVLRGSRLRQRDDVTGARSLERVFGQRRRNELTTTELLDQSLKALCVV